MKVSGAVCDATKRLRDAGVEDPRRDARLLLSAAVGTAHPALLDPDDEVDGEALTRFDATVERRARREPVARIRGSREFWGMEFQLSADTLDPRPDTETLVEAVLEATPNRAAAVRVLDLGTGSGCILAALLRELPNAMGVGVDRSPGAAAAADQNLRRLGLASRAIVLVGDWTAPVSGAFDLVVSNPPYIATGEIETLAPEVVRFDPLRALDGGGDGLAAYRILIPSLRRVLLPDGIAAVEVGQGQAEEVARLFRAAGLDPRPPKTDLSGVARAVVASPNAPQQRR